jgi:hypothetical protein
VTAEELAQIRALIGSKQPPSDADLAVAYDRLGSAEAVALEVLEGRYADLLAGPAKWAVEGDFSVDSSKNIDKLGAAIAGIKGRLNTAPAMTVHSMTRADRCGR